MGPGLLPTPEQVEHRPLRVLMLGHSLIGQEMPAMLDELAESRASEDQPEQLVPHAVLGWGSELRMHWTFDGSNHTERGFDRENYAPLYPGKPGPQLLAQRPPYDVLVMTEVNWLAAPYLIAERTWYRKLPGVPALMEMFKGDVNWFETAEYLVRFAKLARENNPDMRILFYTSWLSRDEASLEWHRGTWLEGLRNQMPYWERVVAEANAQLGGPVIQVLPSNLVLAEAVSRIQAGALGNATEVDDLFRDRVHLSELGHYLIALTLYAVLFGQSPEGLTGDVHTVKGEPFHVDGATAAAMQSLVWDVLKSYRAGS